MGTKWKESWTLTFVSTRGNQLWNVIVKQVTRVSSLSSAYGATLIEHSLIEVGLPGSAKVDSQVDAAQGAVCG